MEGQDLSGAFTTEGLNLQHAVLAQSGLSGDVSLELNQQVSLADIKGLPLNQTIDSHSQVYNIIILHVNRDSHKLPQMKYASILGQKPWTCPTCGEVLTNCLESE